MVNSVPLNLSVSGGALANNLSNCQIYNSSGASSTQALGSSISPSSGQNSFAFSSPLTVNSGSPITLQIRCDVNPGTASGGVFQFTAGSGIGSSTSGGAIAAQADFVKSIPAGLSNAIIGIITLDATRSSQPVVVTSVPISVSASGGADLSALRNCSLNTMAGASLTTGGNVVTAITGSNMLRLDTPLTIPAGQGMLLVMRCNVSSTVPVGSSLTVSLAPSSFQATSNGAPVMVTQGFLSTGVMGTNSGVINVTPAGTSQGSVGTPTTPGTPNTGLGGDAMTYYLMLGLTAVVAIFATRRAIQK